jgi:hypothetical protein
VELPLLLVAGIKGLSKFGIGFALNAFVFSALKTIRRVLPVGVDGAEELFTGTKGFEKSGISFALKFLRLGEGEDP